MLHSWKTLAIAAGMFSAALSADTYTNPQNHYSMTLPPNWTQNPNVSGADVQFLAPPDPMTNASNGYISVISTPTPEGTTLDSYFYQNLSALEGKLNAYSEQDSGSLFISNQQARFIMYDYQDANGQEWSAIQFFMYVKPTAYLITCTALSTVFPQYLPTFKATTASFQLQ